MADKILVCKECNMNFVFTEGEQEFYKQKGFDNEPRRCPECRKARKTAIRSNNNSFAGTNRTFQNRNFESRW